MIDKLLRYIAPHPCISCDDLNGPLCDNCKYNIINEGFDGCVACGKGLGLKGLCGRCRVPYQQAWCVGLREAELELLIDRYKFHRLKSASEPLNSLLSEVLPDLPSETMVVPVPTIRKHIRQRGYDHAALLAKGVATEKGLHYYPALQRSSQAVQHLASRRDRIKQAKQAFSCGVELDPEIPYLLVDDIVTTGSTIRSAAKALRESGARTIWVAVIARQPTGKTDKM